MLVEINLLPQKEPKKASFLIFIAAVSIILLSLGSYYFLQIQTTKSDIANVDSQIMMTKKLAEVEEKNAQTNEAAMSVSVLKNAVEWANTYPIETIPVMQHLTSLLPERGFIKTFGYTEAGTVSLSVQFDSAREAAYFLENLNKSEWIEDANLSSLNTQEKEETKESAAATGAANTTTTNTNTQTTGTTAKTNPSIVVTADPNNPNSIIITQVDPNAVATAPAATQPEVTKEILPRYLGQFELKLNKETIKKLINKGGADEEGVTES